jgi:hypothetical protein
MEQPKKDVFWGLFWAVFICLVVVAGIIILMSKVK